MINITFCTITAFIITYLAIPSIIRVATIKNLFDFPDERKTHKSSIPTLGGLAIFAGVVFSYTFWSAGFSIESTQYIVASIIVMFFIGIKDDIVALSAGKKFAGQLISAAIIVLFADIRLTSLFGVFGIFELNYISSICLSIFTILVIINSINLIDGVDGLAAGLGAIASFTFGLWFYNYEQIGLCILSFSLFSSLLAFLIYNFSPATIFMGDTGSLIIGIIISVLAINFVELSYASPPFAFNFRSSPAMAIAILMVPLFDMVRIFIQRILHGRSPFSADRNHMHHVLQDLGLTHREVALTLYLVNIGFIILALALRHISSLTLLIVECVVVIILSSIPFIIRFFMTRYQNVKKINA